MPPVLAALPVIFGALSTAAPVIGAVTGAVGLGETIANAASGPPQVSQPPNLQQLPPRISPSTIQAGGDTTAADLQARGGGGLSPLFTQLIEGQLGGGGGGTPYTTASG